MSYVYVVEREGLFTDEGQRKLLLVRDHVQRLLKESGAITMSAAMNGYGSGSSWQMLACVDRLVELGELREICYGPCAGQDRIFVQVTT